MQHSFETTKAVAIMTQSADYFAVLKHILSSEGIKSALCNEADVEAKCADPDIVGLIIDVEDDGETASAICQRIKHSAIGKRLEILAIIPNGHNETYMSLMRAGADHCLIRPFWPPHLLTFLKDINPAQRYGSSPSKAHLKLGDIELWPERKRAMVNGTEILLGPIEFKLLEHLLTDPGRIFSRNDLIAAAWPQEVYVQPRTVDVHVGRIRRHLKKATGSDVIRTARSSGYAIELTQRETNPADMTA
ncbi:regulator [Agrobacterium rubi]|uniref:winged helix-turn-helix transcriptional regulator n=1 Tax=Agrobacterium rubi TaxID=28099 RepID=UPI00201B8E19|nr:response regulator transcription factor [Agrobacterium rubi]MCL6655147.1 regulator [Agrobacterium rubi]